MTSIVQLFRSRNRSVYFTVGRRQQSAGEGIVSIYTRIIQTLAKSKTAIHPLDWPNR